MELRKDNEANRIAVVKPSGGEGAGARTQS